MATLFGNTREKRKKIKLKVVIIGASLQAIQAARILHKSNHAEITIISKKNYFEFSNAFVKILNEPLKFNKYALNL